MLSFDATKDLLKSSLKVEECIRSARKTVAYNLSDIVFTMQYNYDKIMKVALDSQMGNQSVRSKVEREGGCEHT